MKQLSKRLFITQAIVLTAFVSVTTVLANGKFFTNLKRGVESPYSLNLGSGNRIYSEDTYTSIDEVSGTITTALGNPVQLNAYKVIKNNNGWQSVLPDGYIYNPATSTGWNNKIKGLQSISYQGNGSLELHYGWTLDNENIIYSYDETLSPNVTYSFSEAPSYFYLKNSTSSNVNINSLNISYSCEEQVYPYNNLKVLMIGNSFADDTVFYTKRVAASLGINIDIYDAYIGGCTVEDHYTNLGTDDLLYSMRSTNGNSWVYADEKSLEDIVTYQAWDIITFQQASAAVGRPASYDHLDELVNDVRTLVGNHPKFYWYQTWAYDKDYMDYYDYFDYFNCDQDAMFDAIIDCYQDEVVTRNLFEDIIPAGTAVQNMRTSYMLDNITRDGKHMSEVHGRYLLALNFISNLFNIDYRLTPCTYKDTGINESYKDVVYECVRNAHKHPLQVTQSAYINWETSNYDLSGYTEIDPELVGNSYYNSTDQTNYARRQGNTSGTSNRYVTTKRFESSTLPVGSLVFIKEGFSYLPDAWTNDSFSWSRPSEAYDNVIEITSSFWSGYKYRAFNIFKAGKGVLTGRFNQVFDSFKIFVPNELASGLKTKEDNAYLSEDTTLFTSKGYNISNYRRLHIDPIIGFYKCDSNHELINSYVDATALRFICTRPFYKANGDLPAGTIIVVDNGWQWRSDCWQGHGSYSPRPDNVSTQFTVLNASFMNNFRLRTFNVSNTDGNTQVSQRAIEFMDHMRIYVPNN